MLALGWGVLLAVTAAVAVLSLAGALDPAIGLLIAAGACAQGAIVTGSTLLVLAEMRRQRRGPARLTWTSVPSLSSPEADAPAAELVATGEMNGRRYALFSDGSVELLTLLGRRRFGTRLPTRASSSVRDPGACCKL